MKPDYYYSDIQSTYQNLGIREGDNVYISGNLGRLGMYEKPTKTEILADHERAILSIIGEEGTLITPTHSFSIIHSGDTFDIETTPSETGPFSEHIRRHSKSVRQYHPFSSSTALGKNAELFCLNNSRHVYGPNSPFDRMIEKETKIVSIGKPISQIVSQVHHAELVMGVPYRYTKEFVIPTSRSDNPEPFYLHALYQNCDIERDRNKKIISSFNDHYDIFQTPIGRASAQCLNSKLLHNHLISMLTDDIYTWLRNPPTKRPYAV